MTPDNSKFSVRLARGQDDLLGAQRLRYVVFVEELGGDGALVDHQGRYERDRFDPFFDHLILVDDSIEPTTHDHVVGVYRLLPGDRLDRVGQFYSEDEYDLSVLKRSGRRLLELGRSCVLAQHRGGSALYLLWNGLARYVAEHEIDVLFGVASFHGTDIGELAQPLSLLHHNHLAPEDLRVKALAPHFQPMNLVAADQIDRVSAMRAVPALIKGYLRLGGFVGEGAFVDHDFNTVDVCLVIDTARLNEKHRQIYERPRTT